MEMQNVALMLGRGLLEAASDPSTAPLANASETGPNCSARISTA